MYHDAHLPETGEARAVAAMLEVASAAHMAMLLSRSELSPNVKDLVAMETLEQLRLRGGDTKSTKLAFKLAVEHLALRLHTTTPAYRRLHIAYTLIRNLGRTNRPEVERALRALRAWMSKGRSRSFALAVASKANELARLDLVTLEIKVELRRIMATIQSNHPEEQAS